MFIGQNSYIYEHNPHASPVYPVRPDSLLTSSQITDGIMPLMVASGAGGNSPARKLWDGMVGPTHLAGWAFD
jgi:hypothetical protein